MQLRDIEANLVHDCDDLFGRLIDEHANLQHCSRNIRRDRFCQLGADMARTIGPEYEPKRTRTEPCRQLCVLRTCNAANLHEQLVHSAAPLNNSASEWPGSSVLMKRSPIRNASYAARLSCRRSAVVFNPLSATAMTSSGIRSIA